MNWRTLVNNVNYISLIPKEFRDRIKKSPVAYLPLGTLEWHGEHLPLGSDGLQSRYFFEKLAQRVGGIVLPMLFLGPDKAIETPDNVYYGMDIHGFPENEYRKLEGSAYWVSDTLFFSIICAILEQLARTGFKIVVAHGHGPSTCFFKKHREEWEKKYGLKLFVCWSDDESDGFLGLQTDHAAVNETSLMMYMYPQLVHMENISNRAEWPIAVWGEDPRIIASRQLGKKAIEIQLERMSDIISSALISLGY